MIVWVKVSESDVKCVVGDDEPDIDDLRETIKKKLWNRFLTTDEDKIVVEDQNVGLNIASTDPLTLASPNGMD